MSDIRSRRCTRPDARRQRRYSRSCLYGYTWTVQPRGASHSHSDISQHCSSKRIHSAESVSRQPEGHEVGSSAGAKVSGSSSPLAFRCSSPVLCFTPLDHPRSLPAVCLISSHACADRRASIQMCLRLSSLRSSDMAPDELCQPPDITEPLSWANRFATSSGFRVAGHLLGVVSASEGTGFHTANFRQHAYDSGLWE